MSMKGFTLVETLVAITIVLLAVTGPLQLVKDSLTASYVSRDQLIATSLAEEGVEYVRRVRDNNYLYNLENPTATRSWLYGINGIGGVDCTTTTGCTVDPIQNTVSVCGSTCPFLTIGPDFLYSQREGASYTPTRFKRQVKLEPIGTNREVLVTVTVTFTTRNTPFTVTVTDSLYNWL